MNLPSKTWRILRCRKYNENRLNDELWWEVQCLKKTWWGFGQAWFTETRSKKSRCGHDYRVPMVFTSENEAAEYLKRVAQNIPKETVVREVVTDLI